MVETPKSSQIQLQNAIFGMENGIFDFWAKNTPQDASKCNPELGNRKNTSDLVIGK